MYVKIQQSHNIQANHILNINTLKNYNVPDFVFEDEKNSKIVKRLKRQDIHNLARDLEHPGVTINENVVVPYLLNKIN